MIEVLHTVSLVFTLVAIVFLWRAHRHMIQGWKQQLKINNAMNDQLKELIHLAHIQDQRIRLLERRPS